MRRGYLWSFKEVCEKGRFFRSMNAIEEIAKTQPKENAGSGTSLRFEYQMNWGLKKLLELEDSGEDYTIAFDYHGYNSLRQRSGCNSRGFLSG